MNKAFVLLRTFHAIGKELDKTSIQLIDLIFFLPYLLFCFVLFFSRNVYSLIFCVLWLNFIVGGSNLSRYTDWQGWLGRVVKIPTLLILVLQCKLHIHVCQP